jgi:uncharacterized alpha/beta hydrolase family protein
MNKKITSIFLLLIICLSIAVLYSYFNQTPKDDKEVNDSIVTYDDNDFGNEIDTIFIEEDDEIEIGEMV